MRGPLVTLALALVIFLASGGAITHAPGSPPITQSGFVLLSPKGQGDSTYEASMVGLGVPPGPGDTLRFSWSVNAGQGPEIYFEIHSHPNASGFIRHYNTHADLAEDSWAIPSADGYMVLWDNPNSASVNVTYTFQLFAPPDLTVLAVFPVILAVIILLLWISRRRPPGPPE